MRKAEIYILGIFLFLTIIIVTALIKSRSSNNESTDKGLLIIQEQGSFTVGGTVITNPGTFDPYKHTPEGQTFHGDHAMFFTRFP